MKTLYTTSKLITMIALLATSVMWAASVDAKIRKDLNQSDEALRAGGKTNSRNVDNPVTALKGPTPIQASSTVVAVTDIGPEGGNVLGLEGFLIDPGNT